MLRRAQATAYLKLGQLKQAYRKAVRVAVERSIHPSLGPSHLLTAIAYHNLACLLDRLCLLDKAVEVLGGAADTLHEHLGALHPWAALATRNIIRMRQRQSDILLGKGPHWGRGAGAGWPAPDAEATGGAAAALADETSVLSGATLTSGRGEDGATTASASLSQKKVAPMPRADQRRREREKREEEERQRQAAIRREKHEAFLKRRAGTSKHTQIAEANPALGAALLGRRRILDTWKPRFFKPPPAWAQDSASVYKAVEGRVTDLATGQRQVLPRGSQLLQRLSHENGVLSAEMAHMGVVELPKPRKGAPQKKKKPTFKPNPGLMSQIELTLMSVLDGSAIGQKGFIDASLAEIRDHVNAQMGVA